MELKPVEICLGNFIESMGNIEMVTGIIKEDDIGNFRVAHSGWHGGKSFMPDDVLYSTNPIPLTEEWRVCFGIDKYDIPKWIKYVHQVQNYFKWTLDINILEIMDWKLLPKKAELNHP